MYLNKGQKPKAKRIKKMNDISKEFINAYKGKEIKSLITAFWIFSEEKCKTENKNKIRRMCFDLHSDIELILIELYRSLMPEKVKELGSWAKICILEQVLEEIDCETYEVSKQNLIKALEY